MARYTGAKTKLSKRVGKNLFLKGARSFSAKDDFAKHPYKPGQHGNKKGSGFARTSEYGKQLLEKQALKFSYGLQEKQLSNLFKKAFRAKGDTGQIALAMLERRLDNVVYRAGLANSRNQARQLVCHGHFMVDGVKTNIPSFTVKKGETITLRPAKATGKFWTEFKLEVPNDVPTWLDTSKKMTIKVLNEPVEADLPKDYSLPFIVELYSRKVA